jgi:hypothetical protein
MAVTTGDGVGQTHNPYLDCGAKEGVLLFNANDEEE